MAIRIKSRGGESVEQMMRRFKKLCEKEGLTKDVKRKAFYEKPSERKRREVRKGAKRREKSDMPVERSSGPGGPGGPGGGGPGGGGGGGGGGSY